MSLEIPTWDKITGALGSTTKEIGGNWANLISDYYNGIDIGLLDPTKKPIIGTLTRYKFEKLAIFDVDQSHSIVFSADDIDTGPTRKVKFRRMNTPFEEDYAVLEGMPQTLLNKIIDSDLNTITDIVDANIKSSAAISKSKLALTDSILATDLTADSVITSKILDANVTLAKLASNSVDSSKIVDGSIVNVDVNDSAGIVYSKLALSNSILNADINTSAAILTSKLADSANFILKNQANTYGNFAQTFLYDTLRINNSAGTFYSQLRSAATANRTPTFPDNSETLTTASTTDTFTNKTFNADGTGNSITNIENADIKAAAAIDWTKISKTGSKLKDLADATGIATSPTTGDVPTWNGSGWINQQPPGSGGGEANTLGSVGTGEGTLPGTKVGSVLNLKSLKQGTNITITNNTNDVTISSTGGGGGITASSTDTLTNKTISRTSNTVTFVGTYKYSIYRDGGAVKLVNNATGAVTSHATLGPAVNAVLADTSEPTAIIHHGFYDLASGFTGWNLIRNTKISIQGHTYINVPQGYTGRVWNLSPTDQVIYNVKVEGGLYDEQGTSPTYLWDCIVMEPISTNHPTTVGAVYECEFKNMWIWRCNRPIYLHITNESWVNQNRFINIYSEGCVILGAEFEHTGTGTTSISGNYFEDVSGQATALDTTNHFPATTHGFKNVIGEFNTFVHCVPWDLTVSGSAVSTMTIGADATATKIIGGIVDSVGYVDNGVRTSKNAWNGMVHNDVATFGGDVTLKETLIVNKNAETGAAETLFSMGTSDASGDSFTLDNLYTANGVFNPIFRGIITSAGQAANRNALYFQGVISDAINTSHAEPIVVFGAKTSTNAVITSGRPIVGIANQFSYIYKFWPDYIELADAKNIAVGTTTGTKIGTSTTQKIGFYNTTPVVQGASIADATGGTTIDTQARTAINAVISRLEALGLIATV